MAHSLPATQKALLQTTYAEPLEVKTIPTPEPLPGTVVVKILSAPVLSYAKEVYNGKRKYPYPTPFTPGSSAVGRMAALGPDATSQKLGQLVYIDCTIRSRDNPSDVFLMGLHEGFSDGSRKLMSEVWRNGSWAEYCRVPLENVYPLKEDRLIGELGYREADLASLGRFLVVYGGLRDIGVQAGETVVVAPATGGFGGAAVMVAVAMGATVIAMARNETALNGLSSRFGPGKVKTVKIAGDVVMDAEEVKKAAGGPIDAAFDISPPMAVNSTHMKSCIMAMRHGGQISLMGGIRDDVAIPYHLIMHKDLVLKGKWMYGREDVQAVIKMVEAGLLKIGEPGGLKVANDYPFNDWEKAFDAAEKNAGWDTCVVMRPS
ncbi:GroES-like protein [Zopfia rhizophila CBS 207.26]|uniref:GroES-like protein n=1 Tax=Zopfia rhizophila CBS 207.26 TaxID=1314779 RepID=A0A6A6DIW1_9PEZI|nr:GroES-like protein [Zopfia rhizophila CBS 207.26]